VSARFDAPAASDRPTLGDCFALLCIALGLIGLIAVEYGATH
jgi:hypothetical protein